MTKQPKSNEAMTTVGGLVNVDQFAGDLAVTFPWNKVSVGGFPGSGKSRTSAEIMAGIYNLMKTKNLLKYDAPLLIIDTERAAQFLVEFFKSKGVPAKGKQTRSLADIQTAFELASQGHFFGIYIDSITHVLKNFIETWQRINRVEKIEMRHYGQINPEWEKQFGRPFVDAETHIVFTGRGTWDYEMVEDEQTHKKTMEKSGVKMQATKDTPYDPNLVVWMNQQQKPGRGGKLSVWREAFILKDRSGQIDGRTFGNVKMGGPIWKDFEPHFSYLLKNYDPKAEARGESVSTDAVVAAPIETDPTAQRRKLALDQIKSYLDSIAPGKTTEERKTCTNLLQRAFNNPSWKFVETLELQALEYGLIQIQADVKLIQDSRQEAA